MNLEEEQADRTDFQARLASSGSALDKYRNIAVGEPGLGGLLRYELICLIAPVPGALGYLLRGRLYPRLLRAAGRGLVVGRSVCLRHPGRIRLGEGVVIDDNCVLDAKGESEEGIAVGDGVILGRNTILSCKGGGIEIGENTNIGANCMFLSETCLSIGRNVLIAGMSYIVAGGSHGTSRTDIPIIRQPMSQKGGVCIGDNCWIGAGVAVLDGVTVGRDSVIGAGAVVTKSVPEFAVAVGVPARVIKLRKSGGEG